MSLISCCVFCGASKGLLRCAACKVTPYCSRDHQVSDRDQHAPVCEKVERARAKVDHKEKVLRDEPGDGPSTSANPFETSVGHFGRILPTHDYICARYTLVKAILEIKTFDAADSAAEHIRDMLRLCRSDHMGFRDLLPALYLRLGRDQEAYDSIKWYETTDDSSIYDWDDMDLPYLDIVNADVFESPQYLGEKYPSLANLVCVDLLKVKMLLDLKNLQKSAFLKDTRLPQELIDRIRYFIPLSNIIRNNAKIMSTTNYHPRMRELFGQAGFLYETVNLFNPHFWPALVDPETHLQARPDTCSTGSKQEMQMVLQHCFDSWNETPEAIDFIKTQIELKASFKAQS
ncbi:MAG: hypothetical protein Q9225_004289 [Loekoesia sp. 1 TL-2023]